MDYSVRLKELRKAKGLTQTDLAKELGMSKGCYNRYETGSRQPSIEALQQLAQYHGISIDYLINGKISDNLGLSTSERYCLELFRSADSRAQNDAIILLSNHVISQHVDDTSPEQTTE